MTSRETRGCYRRSPHRSDRRRGGERAPRIRRRWRRLGASTHTHAEAGAPGGGYKGSDSPPPHKSATAATSPHAHAPPTGAGKSVARSWQQLGEGGCGPAERRLFSGRACNYYNITGSTLSPSHSLLSCGERGKIELPSRGRAPTRALSVKGTRGHAQNRLERRVV